jgi:DNA-binding transcriptional regulator YiaG
VFKFDLAQNNSSAMAPFSAMRVSAYRKWEQGKRNVSGIAAALLLMIEQ